jgi:hypothetical protein
MVVNPEYPLLPISKSVPAPNFVSPPVFVAPSPEANVTDCPAVSITTAEVLFAILEE